MVPFESNAAPVTPLTPANKLVAADAAQIVVAAEIGRRKETVVAVGLTSRDESGTVVVYRVLILSGGIGWFWRAPLVEENPA